MKETFLILGGGIAGLSAAEAIRGLNGEARIIMVCGEPTLPYSRPMLTKTPLRDFRAERYLIHEAGWYAQNRIETLLGRRVASLDIAAKAVALENGERLNYDKCVYALGAECFVPPVTGGDKKGVAVVRSFDDVELIRRMSLKAERAVVVGGGVIGIEIAWELKKAGMHVTVLEQEKTLMERILDGEVSASLEESVRRAGIHVETGVRIESIEGVERAEGVRLEDGACYPADFVVMSCGIRPNVELAREAGVKTGRSVIVNERMETGADGLYACGDCAELDGVNTGTWTQAEAQGSVAGTNAAGGSAEYRTQICPVVVNAAGAGLFAAGDMGKDERKRYEAVTLKHPAPENRFMVNGRGGGEDCYGRYYFTGGRLAGAALIGDLSSMREVKEALEERRVIQDFMREREDERV